MRRVKDSRWPAPKRVIAIACQPRSGSTLLAAALNSTGAAGFCDEMTNAHLLFEGTRRRGEYLFWARLQVSKWWHRLRARRLRGSTKVSRRLALEYVERYPARAMSADGVLAVKQFWQVYRLIMIDNGLDMHHWGVPVVWVRLVRADRLAQAVSLVRAQQSQQWLWNQRAVGTPEYDDDRISAALRGIDEGERGWDDYFTRIGVQPLVIEYTELDEHYDETIRRIFDHVGLSDHPVPAQGTRRQRNAESDQWIGRYQAAHPGVE